MATSNEEAMSYSLWDRLFDKEKRQEYREAKAAARAAGLAAENAVKYGADEAEEVDAEIEIRGGNGAINRIPVKMKSRPGRNQGRRDAAHADAMRAKDRELDALDARIDALEKATEAQAGMMDRGMGALWALLPMVDGWIKAINVSDTLQSKGALMLSHGVTGYAGTAMARKTMGDLGVAYLNLVAAALSAYAYYDASVGLSSILQADTSTSTSGSSELASLDDLALG